MKDHLIFHLPLERDSNTPPCATLAVRREGGHKFSAGLAICSSKDQFSKKVGRTIALARLNGKPIKQSSVEDLIRAVQLAFGNVIGRRGDKGESTGLLILAEEDIHKIDNLIKNMKITRPKGVLAPGTYVAKKMPDGTLKVAIVPED